MNNSETIAHTILHEICDRKSSNYNGMLNTSLIHKNLREITISVIICIAKVYYNFLDEIFEELTDLQTKMLLDAS